MFKKLLVCICCLHILFPVFAQVRELTDEEKHRMSKDIRDEFNIFQNKGAAFEDGLKLMKYNSPQFQSLKADIIKEYPEIENIFSQHPESLHPNIVRNFLARQIFNDFKSKYIEDMYMRALKTGRNVIRILRFNDGDNEERYLDEGKLDTEQCRLDFETRNICDYPDGFEEYRMLVESTKLNENDFIDSVTVIRDYPADNIRIQMTIEMQRDVAMGDGDYTEDTFLEFTGMQYKYDEYYAWRKSDAEDIRAGKYVRCSDADNKNQPKMFQCEWKIDDSRDWKSRHLPDWQAVGVTKDWTVQSN